MTTNHIQAQLAFRSGNIPLALELLKSDDSEIALAMLREHYLGEGDVDSAKPYLNKLAEKDSVEGLISQSVLRFLEESLNEAISLANKAIDQDASSAAAYNHLGRALQNAGQSVRASKAFKKALKHDPQYAQAWHNIALTRRAIGAMNEAVDLYKKAIEINPAYESAWLNLGLTYAVTERHSDALSASEKLLSINNQHTQAMVNAGLACHAMTQYDKAMQYFDDAIAVDANFALAYTYKGILFSELQQSQRAIECLRHAITLDETDIDAWCELANTHEKLNDLPAALQANERALSLDARYPTALIDAARIARRQKNTDKALSYIQQVNESQLPYRKAVEFLYEKGEILDKAGQYEGAFATYTQANNLATQSPRYRYFDKLALGQHLANIQSGLQQFSPPQKPASGFLSKLFGRKHKNADAPNPHLGHGLCFLVGFPRSGTTLIDTMISTNPAVISLEEKPTVEDVFDHLAEQKIDRWDINFHQEADWDALRTIYFDSIQKHIGESEHQLIVDKLPFRFLEAYFIRQLFPQAKFLFLQRQPADVVLSNFMQHFSPNETFIHFNDFARCVEVYDQSMLLWYQLRDYLGDDLLQVRYEDLIAKTEGTLQQVCQFLGIDYSANMLTTSKRLATRQRVSTNSYAQVSQDIYTGSINRWQHYRDAFTPHLPTLAQHQQTLGYASDDK